MMNPNDYFYPDPDKRPTIVKTKTLKAVNTKRCKNKAIDKIEHRGDCKVFYLKPKI